MGNQHALSAKKGSMKEAKFVGYYNDDGEALYQGQGSDVENDYTIYAESYDDPYEGQTISLTTSTRRLLFLDDGKPKSFAFKGYGEGKYHDFLVDGIVRSRHTWPGDSKFYTFLETLAISKRPDVSDLPIALVTERLYNYDYWDDDSGYETRPYAPEIIFFVSKKSKRISESSRDKVTEKNNDYWEGVFQYDINGDGSTPIYKEPEPVYKEPKNSINGKKIRGSKQNDAITGKRKNDLIDGLKGNDILSGAKGADLIYGKAGIDHLYGDKGNDFLNGGADDDLLTGGPGRDIFKLSTGHDQVADFNLEDGDQIAIPVEDIDNLQIIEGDSGSATIAIANYGQIMLEGIPKTIIELNYDSIFLRHANE